MTLDNTDNNGRKLFGTDGIRGIANQYPITAELALKLGRALSIAFKQKNNPYKKNKKTKILIGKDTRISGYMIEYALTSGIISMGTDVLLIGPMPTPAIAHLTKSFGADCGIVISASHNPAEHNGIKIFDSQGFKLDDEFEKQIEQIIFSNDEKINGELNAVNNFSKIGKAFRVDDASGRYIEFLKNTIKNKRLNKIKVVLDCANGAAYKIAPTVLKELGCDVFIYNNKPNGLNINQNCGALYAEKLKQIVLAHEADIGLCLDGDADRLIVLDEKGNVVDGDHIMAMCAIDMKEKNKLKNNTIVATVMSNIGLDIAMKEKGINLIKTKVGDRYVIEEMRKNSDKNNHNSYNSQFNFGGEQSGHLIFLDYSTTGDGILSALQILKLLKEKNKKNNQNLQNTSKSFKMSELADCMTSYPQILVNVMVKEKRDFLGIPNLNATVSEVENELNQKGGGRILLRYSGTENKARVMLEGKDKKFIEKKANEIANIIKNAIGIEQQGEIRG